MSEMTCRYTGDREAVLMSYLYDEIAPVERVEFDAHLEGCARCRTELSALGGVRDQLARWAPPEPSFAVASRQPAVVSEQSPVAGRSRQSWWKEIPAWAQVAAAMLFLGVAAGIANLDVRYDANGLSVRTGWSKANPANANLANANPANPANLSNLANPDSAPWRTELAALERQLRGEFRAAPAAASSAASGIMRNTAADAEIFRRVRSIVDESERRQQRELALRVAELARDLDVQRRADLRKIDQSLGVIEDRTGTAVLKNRATLDMLLQRVSVRQ